MTNKKIAELDAEFIEYKAKGKASMDALEKKIDDGIGKLDARIKGMKEESDAKFEELRQLILADPSTAIGKNQRSDFIELEDSSSKPVQGKLDHMNDDRNRPRTSFGSEFKATDAYGWIYRVERYFEIQELPQQEQLRAAALCMDGEALLFQQSPGNLYEQFLAITQEESARAYVALFEKLACQLVGISESVMEATFIKGLKPALRATFRVMNPE
ncbi:hypothetical protein Tco_0379130, partial [Tanacetum coccineum]